MTADETAQAEMAPGYREFVRSITEHLDVAPSRPLLGIPRWTVRSRCYPWFRPQAVLGSEHRARKVAQRWHAAHGQALVAIRDGYDLTLYGSRRVRAEATRIYHDLGWAGQDPDGSTPAEIHLRVAEVIDQSRGGF